MDGCNGAGEKQKAMTLKKTDEIFFPAAGFVSISNLMKMLLWKS